MWILIFGIPVICALAVWWSPLSFVPVPWPDDSAFYFVARELFKIPPRWVMLPQAPFEPTYRIFNYNTMPLFPILIGLGRWVGIDGSHLLKLWPLAFWAASGSLACITLRKQGLSAGAALLLALAFGLDPELRWASVLIRPESLVGLLGTALVLGLTFGFPERLRARGRFWDPASALLAAAAFTHFNSVFLLFPVIVAYFENPRKLIRTGLLTALYLLPYWIMILLHPALFVQQMKTQWTRLAVSNGWLSTPQSALESLFQSMGSPFPWHPITLKAAVLLWVLILSALLALAAELFPKPRPKLEVHPSKPRLGISAAWVLGACWLWHTKPEVWFVYYIHLAALVFAGIAWLAVEETRKIALVMILTALVGIFGFADGVQLQELSRGESWKWSSYETLIDCIDRQLTALDAALLHPKPFRVWDPTFPDVTVELSRRHPDWDFTRTNDFHERNSLALAHGHEVEAVVVPETINWYERHIDAPASEHPEIRSVWMTWKDYYLHHLYDEPGWKPNRYLCQVGRWQAFLFMNTPPK